MLVQYNVDIQRNYILSNLHVIKLKRKSNTIMDALYFSNKSHNLIAPNVDILLPNISNVSNVWLFSKLFANAIAPSLPILFSLRFNLRNVLFISNAI